MKSWVVLIAICVMGFGSAAHELNGMRVVSVLDGNTVEVMGTDNEIKKIVLDGIDSPELGQAYGDKAKRLLEKLALEKVVTVMITGRDRHGNYLGVIMIADKIDPRIELLKEGLAWTAERNPQPALENYRLKAQEKGRGLWKEEEQTPPWIFRRQQSMLTPKGS